ncbi:hypothetical protein KFK09_020335 [Dendrobium nobile]|uniref:Uncharacterized protein n=1 Tax=Dendrobium nobile TaxID=94219 RepID=A0A8T3AUN4_DENNO|nr:hypothetical protein KFK09_020335 [Dendrobium nobile]
MDTRPFRHSPCTESKGSSSAYPDRDLSRLRPSTNNFFLRRRVAEESLSKYRMRRGRKVATNEEVAWIQR